MKNILFMVTILTVETIAYRIVCGILGLPAEFCVKTLSIFLVLMLGNKHYTRKSDLIWDEMRNVLRTITFFTLIVVIISADILDSDEMIKVLLLTLSMIPITIGVSRTIRIMFRRYFSFKTIVIGDGWEVKRYLDVAKNNRFSLVDVKGVVSLECKDELRSNQVTYSNGNRNIIKYGLDQLDEAIVKTEADQIVILINEESHGLRDVVAESVHGKAVRIKSLITGGGFLTFTSKIQDFDGLLLCSNSRSVMGIGSRILKRAIDIVAGIAGCIITGPLYFAIKKQYRKDGDLAPIFFTQERIGRGGNPIKIYKFRTMVENAELLLEDLMENNPDIREEYLTNKKIENDPRVTRMGDKYRRNSLDEFPQFWNVLKGEMSLVGPRPYLYREKEDMGIYYDTIIASKPGITGMWQANGRSDVSFEERCKFDNYYYKNWSITMEFIIIYKTIKGVLYGKGAM